MPPDTLFLEHGKDVGILYMRGRLAASFIRWMTRAREMLTFEASQPDGDRS